MNNHHFNRFGTCLVLAVVVALALPPDISIAQQRSTSEELQAARAVMQAESPEEILKLLDEFLEKYPESGYLTQGVLDRGITTIAQLDPEDPRLTKYAELYIRLYAQVADEAMGYNNAAWYLYEANAALDRAAAWADTAVALLPEGETDEQKAERAMVVDTVAHIAFARGDISTAIQRQKEVVELAPDDDPNYIEYKTELSKFLVAEGRWDEAESYLVEVLLGSGPEKGAVMFKNARIAVAQVYAESGDYESALEILEPVGQLVAPNDLDYYLTRGNAFRELGKTDEAIATYLECASLYPHPSIMEPLQTLWEETYGAESSLTDTLRSLGEEMGSWHPSGTFTPTGDLPGRVVLSELFTGSECPPCVAADLAYDALVAFYPSSLSAVLVYHEHIPGPDPMTNPDTITRMDYYNSEERVVGGTPTTIVNGVLLPGGGGGAAAAKGKFGLYGWTIEQAMKEAPAVNIDLAGERSDQSLTVSATVMVKDPAALEGSDLKLRIVVAERLVHFTGGNGVSEHSMVVRAFVGGHDGFAISQESANFTASLDIAQLESNLLDYLTEYESENPQRFRSGEGFSEKKNEIDENQLLLVAFVQDDTSKKVLQVRVLELK